MRRNKLFVLLLAFATANLAGAASQAPPAQKADEGGTYEIDFSPLPANEFREYKLHITTQARSGITFKDTVDTNGGISPKDMRDFVKDMYESVDWTVRAEGDTRLIVEGLGGSPVVKMEFKVEGLPPNRTPKVKRLEKK
jgi:hypothetical protein